MGVSETHSYHKTVALYTAVIGAIFNDVTIVRSDNKTIKVPIANSDKADYNTRLEQNPDAGEDIEFAARYPRLAYRLVGWEKDLTRATNKFLQLSDQTVDRNVATDVNTQYNRIPYKFTFILEAKTKYMDDMLQIFEQIVTRFNPNIQVMVSDNPDLNQTSSLNITLDSSSKSDNSESAFEGVDGITAEFNLTLDGYLYMPTNNLGIIKTINLSYFDLDIQDHLIDTDVIT